MTFPTDPLKIKAEIALGADITADPTGWSWTDISDYVRTADGARVTINRGRRNDSGSITPATATLELDNTGGRFCTQYPLGAYYPLLQINTPIRISVSTDSGATWSVRYSGYLSRLPTTWRGPAGSDSWASVTADSVLRRAGDEPSRSPLRWTAPNLQDGCIEYWPIEDGTSAVEAASYFPDGVPMTAGGSLEFGASSPPSGSAATAQSDYEFMSANPPSLTGLVRPYVNTGAWSVLGIFKTDQESAVNQVLLDCNVHHDETSTALVQLRLVLQNDRLTVEAYDGSDALMNSVTTGALTANKPGDGEWHAFGISALDTGLTTTITLRYEGASYSFAFLDAFAAIQKVSFPSTAITTEANLLAVGHLAVYSDDLGPTMVDTYAAAMDSHLTAAGERADLRMSRLIGETDLIHSVGTIIGETDMIERLGPQADANAYSSIEDAAETDGGIVYEPRDFDDDTLTYLTRSAINLNAISTPAMTLDQGDFSVLDQDDDDYLLTTSVTVTSGGSSATAVQAPVQNETTVAKNVRFPDRLPDHAGWEVYRGTRRDYRYPRIGVNLHAATGQIAAWKNTEIGDRVLIDDPPPGVVNDIDLILEGYQETVRQFEWSVEMYCSPASRYRIARLDHTTYGRMDTAGSRLVNAVDSSVTSLDVETYEGAEWATSDGLTLPGVVGSYAATPHHASLNPTGNIEFEFDIEPDSWATGATQSVVGEFDTGNRSYVVTVRSTGELGFGYSTDGTTLVTRPSTVPAPVGRRICMVQFIRDNGAAGHDVKFFTREPGGSYTQLGATVTNAGVITLFGGTAPLEIGANSSGTSAPFAGKIRWVTVRSGLGGTLIADAQLDQQPYGTTSFTDSAGRTWTVNGTAALQQRLGFAVGVGGERMTATRVDGAFSDTFTRSVSNGWGTSTSGHAWSVTGGSASDYSVNGSRGLIACSAVNSLRSTYIAGLQVAAIDRTFTVRVPVTPTGAGIQVRSMARWDVAANTYYMGQIQVETTGAVTASIRKSIAGVNTTLRTKTVTGLTHTVTTDYRLRFKVQGSWLYFKVWSGTATEPAQWTDIAYDTDITAAGAWGVRATLLAGNTNALPVTIQVDNDAMLHPQRFTVTRMVNLVSKTHSAGAAVGLFQPNYLGL